MRYASPAGRQAVGDLSAGALAWTALAWSMMTAVAPSARGDAFLPYATRTHRYAAWSTTVTGDLDTVGMAGAMVGLADSRIGTVDNPAGLPLTLDATGLQFTGNAVQDGYVQSEAALIRTNDFVATFCPYPWGVGVAGWAPQSEGDAYQVGGQGQQLSVATREYHLSAANLFWGDRLSLGLSLIAGQNEQSFTPAGGGATVSRSAWGFGGTLGALYVLPGRVILGASFTPPIHYSMGDQGPDNPALAGYFQDADAPYRLGVGASWLPNRLFKVAVGLYLMGATDGVALLSDDSRLVGTAPTLQPRLGLAYRLAEYKEFVVDLSLGTYLEEMRIQDDYSRLHATLALELKPWVLVFGWGLDEARFYRNWTYSAGIDLGRVLRKLDLIPRPPAYAYAGMLPSPARFSDEGMAHALNPAWQHAGENVIDVGLAVPGKLKDRVLSAPEDVRNFGGQVIDTLKWLPGGVLKEGAGLWQRGEEAAPKLSPFSKP